MAPKTVTSPAKLAIILNYFHTSGVAHSIKDLEKALPSVASVNGMQVKDYLQALYDESQIRMEKIGSGNWYWSFPSEERRNKLALLERAKEEWSKASNSLSDIKEKIADARHSRQEEQDGNGTGRVEFLKVHGKLEEDLYSLRAELANFADNDPIEREKKIMEISELKERASKWMDHVQEMEKWLKNTAGMNPEQLGELKKEMYEEEFDEDQDGLREY